MEKFKIGDIVGRKSYNKDILFRVKNIIDTKIGQIAILIGMIERVEADSELSDLEKVSDERIEKDLNIIQKRIDRKINQLDKVEENRNKYTITGKILHLDGDTHLSNLKKCSNINTYKQVIFNHDQNNVSNC